jgi:hypothetical protein
MCNKLRRYRLAGPDEIARSRVINDFFNNLTRTYHDKINTSYDLETMNRMQEDFWVVEEIVEKWVDEGFSDAETIDKVIEYWRYEGEHAEVPPVDRVRWGLPLEMAVVYALALLHQRRQLDVVSDPAD